MSLHLSYDGEGHFSGIQDDTGRSITYSYEGEQLIRVQGADGTETGYRYDAGGNLEEVLSPAGIIGVHTEYDSENRAVKQTFPDGSAMEFSYEEEGQVLLTERNQSGRSTAITEGTRTRKPSMRTERRHMPITAAGS